MKFFKKEDIAKIKYTSPVLINSNLDHETKLKKLTVLLEIMNDFSNSDSDDDKETNAMFQYHMLLDYTKASEEALCLINNTTEAIKQPVLK